MGLRLGGTGGTCHDWPVKAAGRQRCSGTCWEGAVVGRRGGPRGDATGDLAGEGPEDWEPAGGRVVACRHCGLTTSESWRQPQWWKKVGVGPPVSRQEAGAGRPLAGREAAVTGSNVAGECVASSSRGCREGRVLQKGSPEEKG